MAVGFWDSFFDSDHRQRSDINDLRDNTEYVSADIENIRAHCSRLQRQVTDLSVLVSVLVKVLEEGGQVDAKVLRYRVEAELEALAAAKLAGPASLGDSLRAGGSAASPPEPEAPTTPTTCGKCGQVVPANRTTITESGVVCDRCAG